MGVILPVTAGVPTCAVAHLSARVGQGQGPHSPAWLRVGHQAVKVRAGFAGGEGGGGHGDLRRGAYVIKYEKSIGEQHLVGLSPAD
jgi:hypothetical protein